VKHTATFCTRTSAACGVVDRQNRELDDKFGRSSKSKPHRIGHEPKVFRWDRPAKRQR